MKTREKRKVLIPLIAVAMVIPVVLALALSVTAPGTVDRLEDLPGPVDSVAIEWLEDREVYEFRVLLDDMGGFLSFELGIEEGPVPQLLPTDSPVAPGSWTPLNREGKTDG